MESLSLELEYSADLTIRFWVMSYENFNIDPMVWLMGKTPITKNFMKKNYELWAFPELRETELAALYCMHAKNPQSSRSILECDLL